MHTFGARKKMNVKDADVAFVNKNYSMELSFRSLDNSSR